eukprot:60190-Chlamydomonas_euryale.AAC.5
MRACAGLDYRRARPKRVGACLNAYMLHSLMTASLQGSADWLIDGRMHERTDTWIKWTHAWNKRTDGMDAQMEWTHIWTGCTNGMDARNGTQEWCLFGSNS